MKRGRHARAPALGIAPVDRDALVQRASAYPLMRSVAASRLGVRAVVAVMLAAVAWAVAVRGEPSAFGDDGARIGRMTRGGCAYDTRYDEGRRHVADPVYTVDPPAGGDHAPQPAAAGAYRGAAVPRDAALVHAMEHGLVVIWVRPGTDMAPYVAAARDAVVVVERPSLPVAVAASSWHRRLTCPAADVAAVRLFVCTFNGRGPERVRARTAC